jgi:acetoin:2,6-dichlorophenolindophenol oxidoreductase subunit alpha
MKNKGPVRPGHIAPASGDEDIPRAIRLALYQLMVEARTVEKRISDLFLQNLVKGTSHLALGQEAVAAGVALAMERDDYSFLTFRGHHHTVARGASVKAVLGEMMGRECGLLAGKGGSMHLADVGRNIMGSYAILGAQLPIACGAAWSAQYRGSRQVVVVFFGDGTANLGAFHEAINLAAVWKLPVVFVCENNLYAEYTPSHAVTSVEHPAADRASAYGLERIVIDGNDADVVYRKAHRALAQARDGDGPSIIECMTYRLCGHSRADPAAYRPKGELEEWQQRDPLSVYRRRLLGLGIEEASLTKIESEVQRAVDQATEEAKASPPPAESVALRDVWADGGAAWRN